MTLRKGTGKIAAIGSVALVLLLILAAFLVMQAGRVKPTTLYSAVFLDSGQAYFGKLESLGTPWSPYIVLTDVYYVQSVTNADTKQTNNILVKRGKEWHGPDRMIINEKALVMVEPVGVDSTVAKLIADSKR